MGDEKKDPSEDSKEIDRTEVAENDTLKVRLEEAKSSAPVLVVISGKPLGKSFLLTKSISILGRDLAADISIGETAISRKHVEFSMTPDGITCRDLGSLNGTYVNDDKMEPKQIRKLNDGDLVRCGTTILKFLKEGKMENVHYGKMYDMATTDALTGAFNKKAILEILEEEFNRSQQKNLDLTLLMFDIDHFKKINDMHGHLAGDHILKETCNLIKNKMIRQKDVLGRYGGEEFALVLRDTNLRIGAEVAERIRFAVEKYAFEFEQKLIPVTISVGLATVDTTTKNIEDLIDHSDKALYDAKNQGRNRVCVR